MWFQLSENASGLPIRKPADTTTGAGFLLVAYSCRTLGRHADSCALRIQEVRRNEIIKIQVLSLGFVVIVAMFEVKRNKGNVNNDAARLS